MSLPPSLSASLEEWRAFAEELAHAAGGITTRYFRTAVPRELKADDSPVTLADKETETVLREMIREYYPEHGIYGEEWGLENADSDLRWVIDPIDGTRAFIAGIPTFVTLIALCYNGVPVLGVIDQPVLKERWVGVSGKPTTFNGAPFSAVTDPQGEIGNAMLGTTDPNLFSEIAIEKFRALRAVCGQLVCGGDGYLYARLTTGCPHLVCEHGLKPHDIAALRPVLEGAGSVITDWQGQPLTLESAGDVIAACTPALHRAALAKLAT